MNRVRPSIGSALAVVAMLALEPWSPGALAREQEPGPAIEKEAMATLEKMGGYLRGLKTFQVVAQTTTEEVLEDGQKVQFAGEVNGLARMPDRLRLTTTSDRRDRLYVYDGKEFTMLARRANFYATVAAPATIGLLADMLDEKYAISLPLEDLFRWGGVAEPVRRHHGRDVHRAERGRRGDLRALRLPAGGARLAGVDPAGRPPAAAQDGAHHHH